MQKGRYLLLSLIALGSIPSILAQNAETTGDKNAHHIVVPITTKSLAGVVSGDPSKPGAQFVIRRRAYGIYTQDATWSNPLFLVSRPRSPC
jgi:hypothetical protein